MNEFMFGFLLVIGVVKFYATWALILGQFIRTGEKHYGSNR